MVFDSYRRRQVYFGGNPWGGNGATNTTAFWNGSDWAFLNNAPDAPPPSVRFNHAAAYDSLRHATVIFGGETDRFTHSLAPSDTWELVAVDTPLINEQPASQYRRPGDAAVFHVSAVGPPGSALSYQWYHNDQPITDDHAGNIIGLGTAILALQSTTTTDGGTYHVEVAGDCGKTQSLLARLTFEPKLQIFTASDTTTLIWSDPSVILEQADTLSGPWFVVPGATSPFNPANVGPVKFFRVRPGP
jgi:hypothetical protein